jgi:hypothetical protein
MMPARLQLDFVNTSQQFSLPGALVLVFGVIAATLTVADYRDLTLQSAMLEIQSGAVRPGGGRATRSVSIDPKAIDEATGIVQELSLPWSGLLDDLEAAGEASRHDIALLSIQPDREKRQVRIGAEARTLPAALAFVQRLQKAGALKYPLLDNHKIRTDSSERPVYFELTADWSLPQ